MGNYVSVAEIRACKFSGDAVDLTAYSDAEIETEIGVAEAMVDVILCDWFDPRATTLFLDGNGHQELFFSPGTPARAISITSVEEVGIDGTTVKTTYTEDDDFKLYDYHLGLVKNSTTFSARHFGRGNFPLGEKNIKIVGTFGRATTPEPIVAAIKLLVIETLQPGSTGMAASDVIQAVWNDFTITFRAGEAGTGMSTGFSVVDGYLQPYVNYAHMFMVTTPKRTLHDNN